MIWKTNRALWLRSLSVARMTKGLPSSPRTTLLTGAASLISPTYLLKGKRKIKRKKKKKEDTVAKEEKLHIKPLKAIICFQYPTQ